MMSSPAAAPTVHRGRGVSYFAGRVVCPLAGLGRRPDDASNRLVLAGGDTEVTIDRAAGRITVRDERAYAEKAVVADFMFLADGYGEDGARTPFTIHLKVEKTGRRYSIDLHRHVPHQRPIVRAEYEPFEIVAVDGDRSEVVCERRRAEQLVGQTSLARRVAGSLLTTRDHVAGAAQDPARPGYRVADLSIGVGALGLAYMVARAQLVSLDAANAPLIAAGSVPAMLRDGAWELRLTALSDKFLHDLVRRDLFVYGLEDVPLLREVRARGLRKHQTFAFRFSRGAGDLVLDGAVAPLPDALDIARAYIEFHAIGGLLAESVAARARGARA